MPSGTQPGGLHTVAWCVRGMSRREVVRAMKPSGPLSARARPCVRPSPHDEQVAACNLQTCSKEPNQLRVLAAHVLPSRVKSVDQGASLVV
jgi:hypothetical protein